MNGSTGGYDDRSTRQRLAAATQYAGDDVALESVVVQYENRPDRCTVVPRECSEAERVTTWLSADVGAFVDLEDAR
ncbi:DUF7511 domain-containing protein [Natrinema marinum]|uniref:DUF7511 domain-containing protein n=1 Tax=Natrinema marinum TaxID=2961598 RepID=UPI0020C8524D|nr:hypothetical protein [Natrinema marinum]